MRTKILLLFLTLAVLPSPSFAQLDLEQEVLVIPDTHNEKPYIRRVMRDPKEFDLSVEYGAKAGADSEIRLSLGPGTTENVGDIHVFVTDEDLHTYAHVRPVKGEDGRYSFNFDAPQTGKYRLEILFKTGKGWVNLRRDLMIRTEGKGAGSGVKDGDEEYAVKLKLIPKKAYAEHVTTFLYEISYKGEPLRELEKMDGLDMQLATWDEDLKEFIYATPSQNLGGPAVAVSVVFTRPGRHAVFAEFRHKGAVRKIETVVEVLTEPRQGDFIETLRPSD